MLQNTDNIRLFEQATWK